MEKAEKEIRANLAAGVAVSSVIFERQWNSLTKRNPNTGEPIGVLSRAYDKAVSHCVRRVCEIPRKIRRS